MMRTLRTLATLALLAFAALATPAAAQSPSPHIGFVVMHGKGGSPRGYVADLASFLEQKGYLVANLEMPWSGRRQYDVAVDAAEKEVAAALADLRARGATSVFVAGHSQGGLFALHCAGRQAIDGAVAIAPGGNVATPFYQGKVGDSVASARKLVADGRGSEKTTLLDFEGVRGNLPVVTAPAIYLTWFDPDGAMNQSATVKNVSPRVPVLFIVPKGDYPALLRAKQPMFSTLPRHPLTRLYEPDSDHVRAPTAAREEIARWSVEVAGAGPQGMSQPPQMGAEAITYEIYEISNIGRRLIAQGTRQYSVADIKVHPYERNGRKIAEKFLELEQGYRVGARIFSETELTGFGLLARRSDRDFSWEWYRKESGTRFRKLQGGTAVEVSVWGQPFTEELAAVRFLDDTSLGFIAGQGRDDTHKIVIKAGSVLRFR
jgi:pimeloyl-ACP methyl ester carboxylesterase